MPEETLLTLWWDRLRKLRSIMDSLTNNERNELLKLLSEDKVERKNRAINIMIDELKQNHFKVHPEEIKCNWKVYKWKRVYLDLWWLKFQCFISSDKITRQKFENSKLSLKSIHHTDIVDLLNAVWGYMKERLLNIDDSLSIEDYKESIIGYLSGNDVGFCVEKVLDLDGVYLFWLRDLSYGYGVYDNGYWYISCLNDSFSYWYSNCGVEWYFLLK